MSYILEALKKAEQERNLGQIPPLTQSQIPLFSASAADTLPLQRATAWLMGSALLIVVGAGALGHLLPSASPETLKEVKKESTAIFEEKPVEKIEKTQSVISNESHPTSTRPLASIALVQDTQTPQKNPETPKAPPIIAPKIETPPPVPIPKPAPVPVARVVKPTEAIPLVVTSPAPEIQEGLPLFQELSAQIQQRLSPLVIDIHVYAESAQQRFVLINGRRYREGMTLQADLTLLHIRPTDIILRYQNQLFRLNPL
jgi:general secretion pathway protein B